MKISAILTTPRAISRLLPVPKHQTSLNTDILQCMVHSTFDESFFKLHFPMFLRVKLTFIYLY